MTLLKTRLRKLENKLGINNVIFEDIIRLMHYRDSISPEEQQRIISSSLYQYIVNLKSDTISKSD